MYILAQLDLSAVWDKTAGASDVVMKIALSALSPVVSCHRHSERIRHQALHSPSTPTPTPTPPNLVSRPDADAPLISLRLCLLSPFLSGCVVISAFALSLASPLATAAASRASCHSLEGHWSGQLSPGTHHLHAVPSKHSPLPAPSHNF